MISSRQGLCTWISGAFLLMMSLPAAATPMAYNFSADVPEFSDPLFDPLESFLSNDLGLTEITGMVSWDTDDLDASGSGDLEDPGESSVMSDLDAYESDTIGMFVSVENGVLSDVGSWEFDRITTDDVFYLALIHLDTDPKWFVNLGTGESESVTAQNWSLTSKQQVPVPGSLFLLAIGLVVIAGMGCFDMKSRSVRAGTS